ncbi:hypothetical protein VTJ04DRAFT_5224 [Mycothermus thermophilus]|uniref:uncharacterized protein n=1 Tax=Humicola insolens TaxID=85995 RepID=UPI00374499FA
MAITQIPGASPEQPAAAAADPAPAHAPATPSAAPAVAPAAPAGSSWHHHSLSDASTATVDIEAWTVAALQSLNIAPVARGTGGALSIALDDEAGASSAAAAGLKLRGVKFGADGEEQEDGSRRLRRTPSRRDSLRKRESLLMGKEGSRQRRRWENDHLVHVPNVVPPLPSDFQIHPTHRVLPPVPYQLAQYWDVGGLRERVEARKEEEKQRRLYGSGSSKGKGKGKRSKAVAGRGEASNAQEKEAVGDAAAVASTAVSTRYQQHHLNRVPRDLRATVKRTPAAREWLRALEQPVREFVVRCGLASAAAPDNNNKSDGESDMVTEDEEIVFVGRNGSMRDGKPPRDERGDSSKTRSGAGGATGGMVLEVEEGGGGAFQRWLTHSISDYYGLDSKSVTVGNPARRVVYVAVKQQKPPSKSPKNKLQPASRHTEKQQAVLPPPLWEMLF